MTMAKKILVADQDSSIRTVISRALTKIGHHVRSTGSSDDLWSWVSSGEVDLIIADAAMANEGGRDLLSQINKFHPGFPVIIMSAMSNLSNISQINQSASYAYLPKPFDIDEAVELVSRAAGQRTDLAEADMATGAQQMIGQAPAMQEVFRAIGRLSRSSMTVLITGESGTGKELVARALHDNSPRAGKSFIALNTSAITPELLESELFGHEKGAFTGASERRIGRFEQADGGTLFLDEIGDMSVELQTRLLRVLAESEFFRVGGQKPVRVDVRVIAATNQDLSEAVDAGKFREDLFHRLNVMRIDVPPLRNRKEDITALAETYLKQAARELDVQPKTLSIAASGIMMEYGWPGNVRELVNMCRRLTVSAAGAEITTADFPSEFGRFGLRSSDDWTVGLSEWAEDELSSKPRNTLLSKALPAFERTLIEAALRYAHGKRLEAAKLLGWGRNTLSRKIKELDLDSH